MVVATFRFQIILLICWVDTIVGSKDIVITKFMKEQHYCDTCLSCETQIHARSLSKIPQQHQEIDCSNHNCKKPLGLKSTIESLTIKSCKSVTLESEAITALKNLTILDSDEITLRKGAFTYTTGNTTLTIKDCKNVKLEEGTITPDVKSLVVVSPHQSINVTIENITESLELFDGAIDRPFTKVSIANSSIGKYSTRAIRGKGLDAKSIFMENCKSNGFRFLGCREWEGVCRKMVDTDCSIGFDNEYFQSNPDDPTLVLKVRNSHSIFSPQKCYY